MLLKPILRFAFGIFTVGLFLGCDFFDDSCPCTTNIVHNVCVTGNLVNQDSISLLRQTGGGQTDTILVWALDSLSDPQKDLCFRETSGTQRLIAVRNGLKVDSSAWFSQKEDGCCHFKSHSVEFD